MQELNEELNNLQKFNTMTNDTINSNIKSDREPVQAACSDYKSQNL